MVWGREGCGMSRKTFLNSGCILESLGELCILESLNLHYPKGIRKPWWGTGERPGLGVRPWTALAEDLNSVLITHALIASNSSFVLELHIHVCTHTLQSNKNMKTDNNKTTTKKQPWQGLGTVWTQQSSIDGCTVQTKMSVIVLRERSPMLACLGKSRKDLLK